MHESDKKIVIIDYGLGNPKSVQNMLRRVGQNAKISREPDTLRKAQKLILPGVGHFRFGMESLRNFGLIDLLNSIVLDARMPILGICLGAQLFGKRSEEGPCLGLDWIPMETVRFDMSMAKNGEKIPHMGWADTDHKDCPLFQGMKAARFYYVHSYHFHCYRPEIAMCSAEHVYRFVSGVAYRNIFGVQFHPEKSHVYGQQFLHNFASMQSKDI